MESALLMVFVAKWWLNVEMLKKNRIDAFDNQLFAECA